MKASSRSSKWLAPSPPTIAIELAAGRVSIAEVSATGAPIVSGFATEPLPPGAITPALTGTNIADPIVVAQALRRAADRAGLGSSRRAALLVPDTIARVTLVPLEQIPSRAADLDQLVRWQVKKATPFPLEDAQISHFPANVENGVTTVAVVVSRRDVVAQYEAVAAAAGIYPGLVDLASFNVMNAVVAAGAAPAADWLLVSLAADATTLAILRGDKLMFYRHRASLDDEPLSALVHQTAMYHEDRLGGQSFARVWVCGANAADGSGARQEITARLGVPVESVDVRPAVSLRDRIGAGPDILDALAAPVGVLMRERAA
jgi:type IV pilus assembly protein PilM